MKVIASANAQRLSYSPDTGTFVEAGVNAYVDPYFFLATTKGTDADALTAIDEAIGSALASPEMIKIVNNAIKSNPLNLGPDGTKAMMVDGLTNVGVLFAK
jgi:tripartite-type tricarboxylate transporter receptor subunit TctC